MIEKGGKLLENNEKENSKGKYSLNDKKGKFGRKIRRQIIKENMPLIQNEGKFKRKIISKIRENMSLIHTGGK